MQSKQSENLESSIMVNTQTTGEFQCKKLVPLTNEQIRDVLYKHQKSSYEACGIDTEGMKLMDDSLFTELLGYVKAVLAAHGIDNQTKT